MGEIYGHRWTSAFGTHDANDTWAIGLAGLTPEEVGSGLRACLDRADGWPPTLPEFRALCRAPKEHRENAAAYRYTGPSLPHLLNDERRAAGRAAVAAARAALTGAA